MVLLKKYTTARENIKKIPEKNITPAAHRKKNPIISEIP